MRFKDKVVVVTGAGSGMGWATALRVASEGAAVVCLDLDAESAEKTAETINAKDGRAVSLACDVSKKSDLEKAKDLALSTYGSVSDLVNCAGTLTMEGLGDLPQQNWDLVLDVNLKGTFLAIQVFTPELVKAGGGSIVNISSIEAEVVVASGPQTQPHYAASKGGIKAMTRTLAHDLTPKNIRINAIAPGFIATGFAGSEPDSQAYKDYVADHTPFKRPGKPEEIAAAVAFLISDDASYITGVHLPVDGGWLIY